MADPDDPGEAADRLERALARIGEMAGRLQAQARSDVAPPDPHAGSDSVPSMPKPLEPHLAADLAADLTVRLDGIIGQLRAALAAPASE